MKINYKYTTIILTLALIVTYSWHWNDILFHKNNEMKMGIGMNSMHKMQGGGMMNMSDMQGEGMQKDMNMNSMMTDMLANMKSKTGTELEKIFLQDMIIHHQGAVDMSIELLKDKSVRPELAKFASDIISAQTSEISMQKKWLKDWFNVNK